MRVYVAGINGMLGRALKSDFLSNSHEVSGAKSSEVNFIDFEQTVAELVRIQPDLLVIAAAKVGGIGANISSPVSYLSDNILIQTNLLNAAHLANIEKVVFIASSCIYPKNVPQPIVEESLMTGLLEDSNAPYSMAKLAGIKLVQAYRSQYKKNWISVLPTNLYGPHDNFDLEKSHVLPSLMRKFQLAASQGKKYVEIWGDGTPTREFLHVRDAAAAIRIAAEKYSDELPLNIGAKTEHTIREVAELIAQCSGFLGDLVFDAKKPNGAMRKKLDSTRMHSLGWEPKIELAKGLEETYNWLIHSLINGEEVKV
jgi:GDP-L-fucose synthase